MCCVLCVCVCERVLSVVVFFFFCCLVYLVRWPTIVCLFLVDCLFAGLQAKHAVRMESKHGVTHLDAILMFLRRDKKKHARIVVWHWGCGPHVLHAKMKLLPFSPSPHTHSLAHSLMHLTTGSADGYGRNQQCSPHG